MRRWAGALVVGCVFALAGCGGDDGDGAAGGSGDAGSGEPYRIGAAVDITGAFSSTAAPKLEGLQLYAEWINSKGGIDGHPLEIEVRDNQSNPSQAATNARGFLNSDVSAV